MNNSVKCMQIRATAGSTSASSARRTTVSNVTLYPATPASACQPTPRAPGSAASCKPPLDHCQQYGGTGTPDISPSPPALRNCWEGDVRVSALAYWDSKLFACRPISQTRRALSATARSTTSGARPTLRSYWLSETNRTHANSWRALTRGGFSVARRRRRRQSGGLALARNRPQPLFLLDIFLPDRSGWRVPGEPGTLTRDLVNPIDRCCP